MLVLPVRLLTSVHPEYRESQHRWGSNWRRGGSGHDDGAADDNVHEGGVEIVVGW